MVPTATAPDLSKYVFDDKSGYYYDSAANLYYDSNTQYFYNPLSLQFSYWDNDKHTFVPVQQNAGETAKSGVPIPDKDEKKEKPEKQDKVIRVGFFIDTFMLLSLMVSLGLITWPKLSHDFDCHLRR